MRQAGQQRPGCNFTGSLETSMVPIFRLTVFFGLITSVFAGGTLDALVFAANAFPTAIRQQLAAIQGDTSPTEFADKTISYARAKTAYYNALRNAMPELIDIATGKKPRPLELDRFAESFSVVGEKQEKAADETTAVLLKPSSGNPDVEGEGGIRTGARGRRAVPS